MKKKNKYRQQKSFIDLLRGRIPQFENDWTTLLVLILVISFWAFVVYAIGIWSLSIPAIFNLPFNWLFKQGNSP